MLILLVIWIIAIILAPIITRLLAMAVSRKREYLADASGAELTRNPLALASALEKIESAEAPTTSIKKGSAHLCIADPLGKSMNAKEGFFAELFGTHPPISKRIVQLKAMAYQQEHSPIGMREDLHRFSQIAQIGPQIADFEDDRES